MISSYLIKEESIGLKSTLKITLAGVSFAVVLFFLLFYSHALIPTRWLEFALAITLYFFAATMFKEVFKNEEDNEVKELDEKAHKYVYITIVSLESVENATVLAALTFIDISEALIGAFIFISIYVALAINSKSFLTTIPLKKLRFVSAILVTITATSLIIYSIWHKYSRLAALDYSTTRIVNIICLAYQIQTIYYLLYAYYN